MRRKIALLISVALLITVICGSGMASALSDSKTVILQYYDYNNPTQQIVNSALPQTWNVTATNPLYYNQVTSSMYTVMGVTSDSPQIITYYDSYVIMKLLVVWTNGTGYYNNSQIVTLSNGATMSQSLQLANPLPSVPVGTSIVLTANQLGGLQPYSTYLTYSTSNTAIATTSGPVVFGIYPGNCTLYVYYNNSLLISKTITVTGATTPTVVTPTDGLSIGPASFTSVKGRSYRFTGCTIDGEAISAKSLKWYSSNPTVAVVSSAGVVYLRKAGTVTITAKSADGEYSDSVKFLVS